MYPNSLDSIGTSAIRFSSFRRSAAIKKISICTWDARKYMADQNLEKKRLHVYTIGCLFRKSSKHKWFLLDNISLIMLSKWVKTCIMRLSQRNWNLDRHSVRLNKFTSKDSKIIWILWLIIWFISSFYWKVNTTFCLRNASS